MTQPPLPASGRQAARGQSELRALETLHARAVGRRDALVERRAELERDVSLAKGRLALKGEVEKFIEELQAEVHHRNVARFETLLSSVITEVLPGARPISLELSIERGLPALDISLTRESGAREDLYEDNGGALTNVVGMALRMIAVVKAGGARFLALDEGDCWIKPTRVPAFYQVLEDAARRLGVQCLAVSHHDLSVFSTTVPVSELQGSPATGVTVKSASSATDWTEDQDGFRYIRLINAQNYADATLQLSPGLNALTGPNNHGKSTFLRALRSVFYGEARDSLIRDAAKTVTIELGLKHGRILRFSREAKRNPRNIWSLHEADGSVVTEDGQHLETGGKTPPPWLDRMFGIVKTETLDLHLAHQKQPVFLLDKPASQRAAVLSIGQEAGYTRDMMAIHKERCAKDATLSREGEKEIGRIDQALKALDGLGSIGPRIEQAAAYISALEDWRLHLIALEATHARVSAAAARFDGAQRKAEALKTLPEPDAPRLLRDRVSASETRDQAGQRLLAAAARASFANARQTVLASLPEKAPALADTDAMGRLAAGLVGPAERSRRASARVAALSTLVPPPALANDAENAAVLRRLVAGAAAVTTASANETASGIRLDAARREIEDLVADNGGRCPTCGGEASADALLSAHFHAA